MHLLVVCPRKVYMFKVPVVNLLKMVKLPIEQLELTLQPKRGDLSIIIMFHHRLATFKWSFSLGLDLTLGKQFKAVEQASERLLLKMRLFNSHLGKEPWKNCRYFVL